MNVVVNVVPKIPKQLPKQPVLPPLLKSAKSLAKPWRAQGRWFVVGIGGAALLYWNGQLVLSTGAGAGAMLGFYLLQDIGWRATVAELQNWLQDALTGVNRRFALAALCGGGVTLSTYLVSSVWLESPWTATGLVLQGAATLGTLGWLAGRPRVAPNFDAPSLSQLLADLTDADPLKRLMAVRQIPDRTPSIQQAHVIEYFQVLLSQEEHEVVRSAILQSLQQLCAAPPSMPLPLSLAATESPVLTINQPVYESAL
jgi:hypothetical protein